jgi:anaerobic selenocysteine-containing dehydrogenase
MDRRHFVKTGIAALSSLAVGELILLSPGEILANPLPLSPKAKPSRKRYEKLPNDYSKATPFVTACLNCSTTCGVIGYVIDGKVVKIEGNPLDPNARGKTCAKGQSGPTINTYPERLLYPLIRVGKRGEGLWKRISWEDAYKEMASRINKCIDEGVPEQVVFHQGRNRIASETGRFMNAIGSPTVLNHRSLCSSNKRAANYVCIGDTDWETVDAENCKYFLNFGSNFYEAHQGGLGLVQRVIKARFDHGAKLVTFDVRLSNTAGRSDEWYAPFPGTEGAVALAMGHVILKTGNFDAQFINTWTNSSVSELKDFYKEYTPKWAEKVSGIEAKEIERLAVEFASKRPHCAAFTNRGAGAHYNGFYNERAVVILNALVGSVGIKGGYCYGESEKLDAKIYPAPQPEPPKVKARTDLEDPPEWPLANKWQKMKVGQIVYPYIQQGRAKVQVYFSYTLGSPTTWPEGRSNAVEVLEDEKLIPFHICSDVVYSETCHYADLLLPDATYLERWGLETRNNYELRPFVAMRQPMAEPPGDCQSFADTLFELGRRLRPETAKYFQFGNHEAYVKNQCSNIPPGDCKSGFEYMKKYGVYTDLKIPPSYEIYRRALSEAQLKDTRTDEETGVVYAKTDQGEVAIGVKIGDTVYRGFKTPSRRFEIRVQDVIDAGVKVGFVDDGMPRYVPIPAHQNLKSNDLILTTFKWNVHTQARTAPQKYLSEIVHDNPAWINTSTAKKYGLSNGDTIEITAFRPTGHTFQPSGEKLGTAKIKVFVTEGIHPRVIAVSNSVGHLFGGRAATGEEEPLPKHAAYGNPEDDDLGYSLWWDERKGGKGNGTNINAILPINPAPLVGMQAWFDNVCQIRKV